MEALWSTKLIRTIADTDLPGTRLLSRPVLAAADPIDQTVTGSLGETGARRLLFGAALGPAASLEGLRDLWRRNGLGPDHPELRPLASIRDNGDGHELLLVAGPFANAAEAAALCARLVTEAPQCAPVPYLGQDLEP